jgi:hypothetical protein
LDLTFVTIVEGYDMFAAVSTICIFFSYFFNDNNCRLSTVKFKAAMKGKIDTCPDGILASFSPASFFSKDDY